jgi:NAD(P)-dependent dehydrogenase (short-subunit alcohol dehydrogenase family)
MKLPYKVAIVTGGARGIGKEIATSFADAGYAVMIADKDIAKGEETLAEIRTEGGSAEFCRTDISIPAEVNHLMRTANEKLGGIDVLINNAGFGIWKSPDELTVEEWDSVLNTNLRGAFLCSREASIYMKKRGGGSIINIASTRAFMSEPNSEAYAASKGGLVALTHALAASYSKDRIRVNCISPGWIETGDYSKLRDTDHSQHFSGRVGKPFDIAEACLYLVKNDFINGTNLTIDGGMTRKMIYEP